MVVEGVTEALARAITAELDIPTIGIGALLGLRRPGAGHRRHAGHLRLTPKFVRRYADLRTDIDRAVRAYAADVRARRFPGAAETYQLIKRA